MDENEDFTQKEAEYPLLGAPSDYILNDLNNLDDDDIVDFKEEEEDNHNNVQLHEHLFFQKIENFIEDYESFFKSEDEEAKFLYLRDIRKDLIVKISRCPKHTDDDRKIIHLIKPVVKIMNQNSTIDEFVNILINTHDQVSILLNIEILRTLNRISQIYQGFLNPNNINEFISLMNKRTIKDENRLVRHYAIILIGKVVRKSVEWAKLLLPLFEYIFHEINDNQTEFNVFDYYQELKYEMRDILNEVIQNDDPLNYIKISSKKGDPYIYALRGYTKILSDTGIFPLRIVDNIIKMVLRYFYRIIQRLDQYCIDINSAAEKVNILNDIISSNYHGTFEILKNSDVLVKSFLNEAIPAIYQINFISIYTASLRLISSFYRCGKQYHFYFEGFDYHIIFQALFNEKIEIKAPITACECIYNIVDSCEEEGFDLFFEGENIENFNQLMKLTSNSNNPYQKRLALFKLIGILFQYYTSKTIGFDVNLFLESALSGIDEEDFDLSYIIINTLGNMYHRMKLLGLMDDFIDSFTELDGRETMIQAIQSEENELSQIAILFMNTLMEDGAPCAQL